MKCKICNDTGCSECGQWRNKQPVRVEFLWERESKFGVRNGVFPVVTTMDKVEDVKKEHISRCENEGENRKITSIKVYSYDLLETVEL